MAKRAIISYRSLITRYCSVAAAPHAYIALRFERKITAYVIIGRFDDTNHFTQLLPHRFHQIRCFLTAAFSASILPCFRYIGKSLCLSSPMRMDSIPHVLTERIIELICSKIRKPDIQLLTYQKLTFLSDANNLPISCVRIASSVIPICPNFYANLSLSLPMALSYENLLLFLIYRCILLANTP